MAYDVIVIGAGLSGLLGGIRLAEAGRCVLLLAKGHGTTHWANGAIGVSREAEPLAGFARLAADADHPYARVDLATLAAATERLRALCGAADYPLVGTLDHNTLLPTAVGAILPAALYPATMAAGALVLGQDAGPLLIAGFRQLRDFFPPYAAANLRAAGYDARGLWLDLPPTRRRLEFTSTVIAELFEDADFRATVGRQLRALRGDATRIGLPAVVGARSANSVVCELGTLAGAPVFEIPTLPPSVPGIRLYDILARAFQRAGGRLQIGSWVIRAETEGRRVIAVRTEAAAREARYVAGAYLLATGGVAGGGLRTDHTGAIVETAFGLPVRAPADRADWFGPRFSGGQPIHHAGIATDTALRPVDGAGAPLYDNVVVAGAALGGADLLRERSYEGAALATGWHAAATLLNDHAQRAPAAITKAPAD
jgi:glycerol-3-phosphate dehydrogenase subunit B